MQKTKRTKVVRDRRQGRQVVDKDISSAKSRYHVSSLVQIIQDLDENKKQYLRDCDFGAILDLTSGFVPWSFVQWLADHVDVKNEILSFQHKDIPINAESFGHVLGVPAMGVPVPSECKVTTSEFLQFFGLTEMPSIKFFRDKIKKGQEKVEFLRCFMIVALSSFYCPTSSTKPSTAYLGTLMNVEDIETFNWGKFFQQWTLWYINKYQKSSSTLALCNYYIAVRYLDFLDFGSVQIQPSLPRISVWNGDMIKEYIKWDMYDDNFYGKLPIKDIMETCYGEATLLDATTNGHSPEHLRHSIDSIGNSTLNDKVKESICTLFEDYAKDETVSNCSKVKVLLINVLQCLVENNCMATYSQSTEKINCSSQDENKSSGTPIDSGDTLKLPSSDTSNNKESTQVRCCGSQHSHNSAPIPNQKEQQSPQTNIMQEKSKIASTEQIIARMVEPSSDVLQGKMQEPVISRTLSADNKSDEGLHHVNSALGNLQIKEKTDLPYQTNNDIMKETNHAEHSYGNSASLNHLLNSQHDAADDYCDGQTSEGIMDDLLNKKQQE